MAPPTALPPPDLHIPPSSNAVSVSVIDTTTTLRGVDCWKFMQPSIRGHDYLAAPAYSFLIRHPSGRSLVFDLGIRKDWWNLSPFLINRFKSSGYHIDVKNNVREILDAGGVDSSTIEAVIWSHWHFDHTGDPSTFEPSTALVVGPGFKENLLPGYPKNQESALLEADWAGRELREISFDGSGLTIGRFRAFDYFGDGSFYLLDSPGHAIGHMCGLARVTASPVAMFVLMGGDACHHGGECRPSAYLPLPDVITPHPFLPRSSSACDGSLFEPLLQRAADGGPDRTRSFYAPSRGRQPKMHFDEDEAQRSIDKVQEADAHETILFVPAHDETLRGVIDFFPATIDDFATKDWVVRSRWAFLKDFSEAVQWDGEVEGRTDWSHPDKKEA
jgi:glyoxylase-like metal-dependent hydrolase (beta-lactamase superfamily II)